MFLTFCLVEYEGPVTVPNGDQIVLPCWIAGTALGLKLELHGEAVTLLHLHCVLAAAVRLAVVRLRVARATQLPAGAVDRHLGNVDGRLL